MHSVLIRIRQSPSIYKSCLPPPFARAVVLIAFGLLCGCSAESTPVSSSNELPFSGPATLRFDIGDPDILITADIEVTAPAGDPDGGTVTLTHQLNAVIDTLDGANFDLTFSPSSTPSQDPSEPGSMLSAIAINSAAGTMSISTGAGTVAVSGEQSPVAGGGFYSATQGSYDSFDSNGTKEEEGAVQVTGDLTKTELNTLRTAMISFQPRAKGDVAPKSISERANRPLRRAVLGRIGTLDSVWVDAQSSVVVRETSTDRNSGDRLMVRYEYEWQPNGLVVQT